MEEFKRKIRKFRKKKPSLWLPIHSNSNVSSPSWNATLGKRAVYDTYHFVKTMPSIDYLWPVTTSYDLFKLAIWDFFYLRLLLLDIHLCERKLLLFLNLSKCDLQFLRTTKHKPQTNSDRVNSSVRNQIILLKLCNYVKKLVTHLAITRLRLSWDWNSSAPATVFSFLSELCLMLITGYR